MTAERRTLAVNLLQLLPNAAGGLEMYSRELISRLPEALPQWTIRVHVNREGYESCRQWSEHCEWELADFSWHDRLTRAHYESTLLPWRLRRDGSDLLHNMINTACLAPGCPQVTSIADATQILHPETGGLGPRFFRQLLRSAPRRSDAIITISRSAADDLVRAFGVDREKIKLTYLAARTPTEYSDAAARELKSRIGLAPEGRFFVAPLARRPNKNVERLLEAFARVADPDVKLVMTGAHSDGDDLLRTLMRDLGISQRVLLTGWVTDAELDILYSGALALVFPSIAEGFGLPILEAMQVGCPVATSGISSMPEIGGDAATYFDPYSVEEMARRMGELAADAALRKRLAAAGITRAQEFSWERTTQDTLDVYRQVLSGDAAASV